MSRMDFTDEQIMQYVDGDASPELASNISNARVKDKELEARIYKFQLANTVMLKHTKEKKEMPELLYARLRKKRIEKEESLEKKKRARFSFGNFGSGAIAASIAAFGIFIGTGAYQLQTTSNESLAREFYSSFQAGERSDQLVNEIKLANVGVFLDKESSLKKKGLEQKSDKRRTLSGDMKGTIDITVNLKKDFSYKLENGDFVVTGAELGIDLKGLSSGLITLIYQDSKGEKQVLLDRKPIKKGETKSLGPYEVIGPVGLDYIQYIHTPNDNEEKIESQIIGFTILKNGDNLLKTASSNFMAVPRSLFSRTVKIELGNKIIDKSILSIADNASENGNEIGDPNTAIWQRDGSFYIDVNDSGYANIISHRNKENTGWQMSIDRDDNRVIDGLGLVSVDKKGKYSFRWLLDENEDGIIDRVAIDKDGDWKTEKVYPLYPKGSSFSF